MCALTALFLFAVLNAWDGYSVRLTVDRTKPTCDETLWTVPGVATISFRSRGVIEANVTNVGWTLSVPFPSDGSDTVELNVSRARATLTAGGAVDEDFPVVAPPVPEKTVAAMSSARVRNVRMDIPAVARPVEPDEKPIARPIQFWTPDGYNAWVGDVAVCSWKERFHLFYLKDRRHHKSKRGGGGHEFAHLSSDDLVRWVEHPTVVKIENFWESVGTGTPFVWNDKLCLAFGLHTERFRDIYKDIQGGGMYALSSDGIHFTRSGVYFTESRNPTVFNLQNGKLGFIPSYGGKYGLYMSDRPDAWPETAEKLPPVGSSECPCYFEWQGWRYLLRGFWGMAACAPQGEWEDWSRAGKDIYGGLSVPMVASWSGDRRIIAGWINSPEGWGGWLCLHELVRLPGGRLGQKWLPEARYPSAPREYHAKGGEDFSLEFGDLQLKVEAKRARACWCEKNAETEPQTIAELLAAKKNPRDFALNPPHAARIYAISDIPGLDRDYTVRVVSWYDPKGDVTLFDAEIAGVRTMLHCHRGKSPTQPSTPQPLGPTR